jgi:cyclopropane-fatty-acyl-phospholipid synthase
MADWMGKVPASWMARGVDAAEVGLLPDFVLRWAMRRLCAARLQKERETGRTGRDFAEQMATSAVATHTVEANAQHYEVPTAFFLEALGPALKYSACEYPRPDASLEEAERHTLALYCERAGLEDGMTVLDLGCGWGSFTTWVAEHYPRCRVTAVSNSRTQRAFIQQRCDQPGWAQVEVITADAVTFDMGTNRFDRVVSVEMFEHMRNWGPLFDRIAAALKPGGAFFQHVFCHRDHPYLFEDEGEPDWMARNFFSGGIMPSADLPRHVKGALAVERQWLREGTDYARTLRAWLDRVDARRGEIDQIFAADLGGGEARRAVQRWRMFFMACEELFGFDGGREWQVVHSLLRPHSEGEAGA